MARVVKHLSLHRMVGTELQVMAEVEAGVTKIVEVEETVIRGYAQRGNWPHRWVSLFILQNLTPLIRQLLLENKLAATDVATLEQRPMINLYDRADLSRCHVYVNRQAMEQQKYWDEPAVIQGLLAHEHAHPLAENQTVQMARRYHIQLLPDSPARVDEVLGSLMNKLCLVAPSEVFANEWAIQGGFGEALFRLNQCNVGNASQGVAERRVLLRSLKQETRRAQFTATEASLLALVGDFHSYLDMAMETAPFYRTGRHDDALWLERTLDNNIFVHLEPEFRSTYNVLRETYTALQPDFSMEQMRAWGDQVLAVLARPLAEKGYSLKSRWDTIDVGHPEQGEGSNGSRSDVEKRNA